MTKHTLPPLGASISARFVAMTHRGPKDHASVNAVLGADIYNQGNEITCHECILKIASGLDSIWLGEPIVFDTVQCFIVGTGGSLVPTLRCDLPGNSL